MNKLFKFSFTSKHKQKENLNKIENNRQRISVDRICVNYNTQYVTHLDEDNMNINVNNNNNNNITNSTTTNNINIVNSQSSQNNDNNTVLEEKCVVVSEFLKKLKNQSCNILNKIPPVNEYDHKKNGSYNIYRYNMNNCIRLLAINQSQSSTNHAAGDNNHNKIELFKNIDKVVQKATSKLTEMNSSKYNCKSLIYEAENNVVFNEKFDKINYKTDKNNLLKSYQSDVSIAIAENLRYSSQSATNNQVTTCKTVSPTTNSSTNKLSILKSASSSSYDTETSSYINSNCKNILRSNNIIAINASSSSSSSSTSSESELVTLIGKNDAGTSKNLNKAPYLQRNRINVDIQNSQYKSYSCLNAGGKLVELIQDFFNRKSAK